MNVPQRISVKFFVEDGDELEIPPLIPVFHRWIREDSLPGLLIDVANYKHVPNGPILLIVGHEGDYILDRTDGRTGFLYRGKRAWSSDDFKERLRTVWQRAAQAAQLLQSEQTLNGISFSESEAAIDFPDRLNVPNSPATFDAVKDDVESVLEAVSDGRTWKLKYVPLEARRPFRLQAALN